MLMKITLRRENDIVVYERFVDTNKPLRNEYGQPIDIIRVQHDGELVKATIYEEFTQIIINEELNLSIERNLEG